MRLEKNDYGEGVCFHSAVGFKLQVGGLHGRKKLLQLHLSVLVKTAGFVLFSLFQTTEKRAQG